MMRAVYIRRDEYFIQSWCTADNGFMHMLQNTPDPRKSTYCNKYKRMYAQDTHPYKERRCINEVKHGAAHCGGEAHLSR